MRKLGRLGRGVEPLRLYLCMYVCMYVCIYIYILIIYLFTCLCIYMKIIHNNYRFLLVAACMDEQLGVGLHLGPWSISPEDRPLADPKRYDIGVGFSVRV